MDKKEEAELVTLNHTNFIGYIDNLSQLNRKVIEELNSKGWATTNVPANLPITTGNNALDGKSKVFRENWQSMGPLETNWKDKAQKDISKMPEETMEQQQAKMLAQELFNELKDLLFNK